MKNFDPTILFVLFGVLFFAGMFDMPFIIVAFVMYMIFRGASKRKKQSPPRSGRDYHREDRRYSRRYDPTQRRQPQYRERPVRQPQPAPARRRAPKDNPFRSSGLAKFKDYDYDGAIEDFQKALQINNEDVAVHFNLACAYSLTEEKEKSMYHLDRAVALGFKDFEKIRNHDALAFVRIQDEFEAFEENGFRLSSPKATAPRTQGDTELLDQLNKLAELRERGLLTEEEFVFQKKKLLG